MERINTEGMSKIAAKRAQRKELIKALTSTAFDINNTNQQQSFKKYIDAFELNVHQMYLYQALSKGVMVWGGFWMLGRVLGAPEAINYFLYLGVSALVLGNFSQTDFYEQREEMKILYNWCLKNNQLFYATGIDNTPKLSIPHIQLLIKLLAPLCETDFMIAWPNETIKTEEKSGAWNKTANAAFTALASTIGIFTKADEQKDSKQVLIKQLKIQVETRALDLSILNGGDQAIRYFFTSLFNMKFQNIAKQILPAPIDGMVSAYIESFHPKSS
jgi:hypothetical protein